LTATRHGGTRLAPERAAARTASSAAATAALTRAAPAGHAAAPPAPPPCGYRRGRSRSGAVPGQHEVIDPDPLAAAFLDVLVARSYCSRRARWKYPVSIARRLRPSP
jgi:hypothetical protein